MTPRSMGWKITYRWIEGELEGAGRIPAKASRGGTVDLHNIPQLARIVLRREHLHLRGLPELFLFLVIGWSWARWERGAPG